MSCDDIDDIRFVPTDIVQCNKDNESEDDDLALTQRLYGVTNTQRFSSCVDRKLSMIDPRNRFEEMLKERSIGVTFCQKSQSHELCFLNSTTHNEFTKQLRICSSSTPLVLDTFFDEFTSACVPIDCLQLYVSPISSDFGVQDTVLRSFLLLKETQKKAFEFLLKNLGRLAKKSDDYNVRLAIILVAHLRHLNRIFEPISVFNIVFDSQFHLWNPTIRNSLISAIPEIFSDFGLQQDAAVRLNDLLLGSDSIQDIDSFQTTTLETLRILRTDSVVSKKIRENVCRNSMKLSPTSLPAAINFALGTLLVSASQKNDSNEKNIQDFLNDCAKFLKLENILSSQTGSETWNLDLIAYDMFAHFQQFLYLDRKVWKYVSSHIVNLKKVLVPIKDENICDKTCNEEKNDAEEDDPIEAINTFNLMFMICIISSDSCPSTVLAPINAIFSNISSSAASNFLRAIGFIITMKKFANAHIKSMIYIARQCVWSTESNSRVMGINIYERMFIGLEKPQRELIFAELVKHFSTNEEECEAVLEVLCRVIDTNVKTIVPFVENVQECIEWVSVLSLPNIKRLFRVLLKISEINRKEHTLDFDEIINRFLLSVSENDKFLGIVAIIMKMQSDLAKRHTEEQECLIHKNVERIENVIKNSSKLKGAFFQHMKQMLKDCEKLNDVRFLREWSKNLLEEFKNLFIKNSDSGQEKHVLEWNLERQCEVIPMFNLIMEFVKIKLRWNEEDFDSHESSYAVGVIKELGFVLESDVAIEDTDDIDSLSANLYFTIQWCRTLLNAFVTVCSDEFINTDLAKKNVTRIFYRMLDCEKKLAESIKVEDCWKIPQFDFQNTTKISSTCSTEPKSKRNTKGSTDNNRDALHSNPETRSSKKNVKCETQLSFSIKSVLIAFKLRPIIHLINLTENKLICKLYLCEELHRYIHDKIISERNRKHEKLIGKTSTSDKSKSNSISNKWSDNDSVVDWFCFKKAARTIGKIIKNVFNYFSTVRDEDSEEIIQLQNSMEKLGRTSLEILNFLLSREVHDRKLKNIEKEERKETIIRLVAKELIDSDNLTVDIEDVKHIIGSFLVRNAEFAPTPNFAVSLLALFMKINIEETTLRREMAKYALAYLKKNWGSVDEVWRKGAKLNAAVRDILEIYIKLRKEKDRISAMQWILTNKVVQLVPEDEKRKSCVLTQRSEDDMLQTEDQKADYSCINKSTFSVIFKTLFSNLNECVLSKQMSSMAVERGLITEKDALICWEKASTCFLILCLLLRVNNIRTVVVLSSAIKEGKKFLISVSKKSSFMDSLNNINKKSDFDLNNQSIERILSSVQQGNRVLQSIGTYAKTTKCISLLKSFPELRAESESCLRIIHSAMVKNEFLDAFTVGLLKSRSIDGEIITHTVDNQDDSDEN